MTTDRLPNHWLACSLIAGALTLSACSTLKEPGVRPLKQSEVRALFERNTVTSRNLTSGTVSVSYYSRREVTQLRKGDERNGTWRVKRNGQHCLTMEQNEEVCRHIRLDADGMYRKYPSGAAWEKPVLEYVMVEPGKQLNKSAKKRKADIAKIQRLLTAAGYDTGGTDGVWGPRSRTAAMRYEHDKDLPQTGQPTRMLEKSLTAE